MAKRATKRVSRAERYRRWFFFYPLTAALASIVCFVVGLRPLGWFLAIATMFFVLFRSSLLAVLERTSDEER